jgi:uncharacterized damage-inducible protein DinB
MELPVMKTRAALALAEETEAARQELYSYLPRFPEETFRTGDVKTEDNVRGIMVHVTFAIFSYACWLQRVLGRLDLEVEKARKKAFLDRVEAITTAEGFEEASRWGSMMNVESMMEHALVHLMRHRRQLQIHLGLRKGGEIQA